MRGKIIASENTIQKGTPFAEVCAPFYRQVYCGCCPHGNQVFGGPCPRESCPFKNIETRGCSLPQRVAAKQHAGKNRVDVFASSAKKRKQLSQKDAKKVEKIRQTTSVPRADEWCGNLPESLMERQLEKALACGDIDSTHALIPELVW